LRHTQPALSTVVALDNASIHHGIDHETLELDVRKTKISEVQVDAVSRDFTHVYAKYEVDKHSFQIADSL